MKMLVRENERIIVERLREGDIESFEIIYNDYFELLYLFSRKYLRNDAEAEELIQQVFLKVWEKRESINPDLSFKAFIFKTVLNDVYNHIRKKRYEKITSNIYHESLPNYNESTQESIFYRNLKEKIDKLINNLPPKRREIFMLSRKSGLSNDDIADALDLSVRTVENQIHRALNYLKKNLKEDIE
jgi:RNA polymerase sigma-70 factor (ECF subfamily)